MARRNRLLLQKTAPASNPPVVFDVNVLGPPPLRALQR